MSFYKTVGAHGRPVKLASQHAADQIIAKLLRQQARLLSGKTLQEAMPNDIEPRVPHDLKLASRAGWASNCKYG
jgi:hypothetical protein